MLVAAFEGERRVPYLETVAGADEQGEVADAAQMAHRSRDAQPLGVEWVHDADGMFSVAFGPQTDVAWLVRPDKYVGYRASDWSVAAVLDYLRETIGLT